MPKSCGGRSPTSNAFPVLPYSLIPNVMATAVAARLLTTLKRRSALHVADRDRLQSAVKSAD